mmetsp:Transcript_35326/g.94074  ORF Transcript_35326/g.94074 Transcript_35326/m.94074 type:complete len:150 (+) Transcript_35326:81-530(+)
MTVCCECWPWSSQCCPEALTRRRRKAGGFVNGHPVHLLAILGVPARSLEIQLGELLYRDIRPEDYELLVLLDESLPRRTASRELVAGLPEVRPEDLDGERCSVCLADYEAEHSVVILPCAHTFHRACVSRWLLERRPACPLCHVEWVCK